MTHRAKLSAPAKLSAHAKMTLRKKKAPCKSIFVQFAPSCNFITVLVVYNAYL